MNKCCLKLSIGMCQSSSPNDEIIRVMVYEGVSGVNDRSGSDQCGQFSCTKLLYRMAE